MWNPKDINALPISQTDKKRLKGYLCQPREKGGNPIKGKVLLSQLVPDAAILGNPSRTNTARTILAMTQAAMKSSVQLAALCDDRESVLAALEAAAELRAKLTDAGGDYKAASEAIDEMIEQLDECGHECLEAAVPMLDIASGFAASQEPEEVAAVAAPATPTPTRVGRRGVQSVRVYTPPTGGTKPSKAVGPRRGAQTQGVVAGSRAVRKVSARRPLPAPADGPANAAPHPNMTTPPEDVPPPRGAADAEAKATAEKPAKKRAPAEKPAAKKTTAGKSSSKKKSASKKSK